MLKKKICKYVIRFQEYFFNTWSDINVDYNNTFNGRTKKKIIAINGNTVIEYIFETNKNKSVLCL